jgi:hypothetical protein
MDRQRYTPEQLQRIFEQMAGSGMWVPVRNQPAPYVGPAFAVYLKYSELYPDCADVKDRYWRLIQQVPIVNAVGVFATINNILAVTSRDDNAHKVLHQRFLEPDVAERLARNSPAAPAFGVVFHRLGSLVAMRDLLVYGTNRANTTDSPITQIGELALSANDFVERDPIIKGTPTNLELAAQVMRTWDIYNPRDLAYALTRTYTILTTILPGADPTVAKLRGRIGTENLTVDGLSLPEFVAITFALFSYGNVVEREGTNRVVFAPSAFFREYPRAQPLLDRFVVGRSLTVDEYRSKLAGAAPRTRHQFLEDLDAIRGLPSSLSVFRQQPLLQLDDGRVVILDLQFLTDLVITGVYWLIFDALSKSQRDAFKELWGRCFELYVTQLLREFYPLNSSLLSTDTAYSGGQIDALLDFGADVFVFEIKSSLLTEPAKRSADPAMLAADVERKLIRNEKGAPKAVLQLARAAELIASGQIKTTIKPTRVYPVLITDEPACECLAFNAYLNEQFQVELTGAEGVRPLTIMSINECEEMLPYSGRGAFSWAELCETRFRGTEVTVWSVHQAIYDLRHERNIGVQRNEMVLKRFEAVYREILRIFGAEGVEAENKP